MLKKLLSFILVVFISLPVQAFANTEVSIKNAGITPDSPLYTIDLALEKVQLSLTLDESQKAELLSKLAEERVSEGQEMVEEGKIGLGQKALGDYKSVLEDAVEVTEKAVEEEKDMTEAANKLAKKTAQLAQIVEKIIQSLPEEIKTKLAENLRLVADEIDATNEAVEVIQGEEEEAEEEVTEEPAEDVEQPADETEDEGDSLEQDAAHKILEERLGDSAFIDRAATKGLSLKKIMVIKVLSEKTGKSLDEVLDIYLQGGKGIGEGVMSFGFKPKDIFSDIKTAFKGIKEDIKTYAAAPTDSTDISQDGEIEEFIENTAEEAKYDTTAAITSVTNKAKAIKPSQRKSEKIKSNSGNSYGKYKNNNENKKPKNNDKDNGITGKGQNENNNGKSGK